jgi:hypothetical protein
MNMKKPGTYMGKPAGGSFMYGLREKDGKSHAKPVQRIIPAKVRERAVSLKTRPPIL